VPFALASGAARVRGMGEMIAPIIGVKPLWFLIAKPEGGVNTAEAYHMYDLLVPVRNLDTTRKRPDNGRFVEALQAGDVEGMAKAGGNELERAAIHLLPVVGKLLEEMRATGAGYCSMTGSGSAVFGMFASEIEARKAQIKLIGSYWTAVVHAC
jgi:4-diphosphocytidyl-2-C-methyl-D-erythritol kinase